MLGGPSGRRAAPPFRLPARKLHVSAKLAFEQLALVETLAIGCHAVNRGNPQPGETSCRRLRADRVGGLEFAKLTGANVIVLDLNEQRLAFVRSAMGIKHTIQVRGDGSELNALADLTGGTLAEVVIDATGNNKSMSHALNYCAFAGRLVFVGITTQEISFVHPLMHRRELTLLASRNALPPTLRGSSA